jgi:uncharacterized protein RhaS with RHS repeats
MRDYDPTTGRYIQADPLGLVDGASVYGYALQNPGRYTDPTGELIPLIPIAFGAGIGMATGYLFDQYLGDGCYTWQEALTDAAFGATGAGLGARYAWRFGPKSLTRETGKEWSHAVSRKAVEKYAQKATDFVNKKSNRYPGAAAAASRAIDRVAKAMNKRGGYNGSWASSKRHFKHDPSRYPRGWREMGDRFSPPRQMVNRIPDWIKFSFGGAAGSAFGGNAAMDGLR